MSNELHFYKKYTHMYFIANSGGWKSCVHFSYLANKCLISGGCGDKLNILNNKTIEIIKQNNSKLLFY